MKKLILALVFLVISSAVCYAMLTSYDSIMLEGEEVYGKMASVKLWYSEISNMPDPVIIMEDENYKRFYIHFTPSQRPTVKAMKKHGIYQVKFVVVDNYVLGIDGEFKSAKFVRMGGKDYF